MKTIHDEYFIGFIEGEGCFYVSVVRSQETTSGWQVVHFFKVSQNPRGRTVLRALQKRLGCGYIKANGSQSSSDKSLAYVVRNILDLQEKVIPFLKGKLIIKQEDFSRFEKVVEIVSLKAHLKKSGMKCILDLAFQMNTKQRKYTRKEILSSFL